MARAKSDLIALELEKFENKIFEFQKYLDDKDINQIYEDGIRAKEIDIQLKLMNAIPFLLEQLEKLRQQKTERIETYGGKKVSGIAEDFLKS